jgi:hypothetical protein
MHDKRFFRRNTEQMWRCEKQVCHVNTAAWATNIQAEQMAKL